MAAIPWFLLFITSCTLQLNCSEARMKSYGDSEDFLWTQDRQTRSLLDTGGKMISTADL